MKKLLLLFLLSFSMGMNAQVPIYQTTITGTSGGELTSLPNGAATQMGDGIVLAGTQRFLNSIVVNLFSLVVTTPYTATMTLYTDCPTITGVGACGSGTGTLIPGSSVTVTVTPSANVGVAQNVTFPFSSLNLASETDNTIYVMIRASRENVNWTLGETPTIGAMPAGETGNGAVTRCGSTSANNGCARNFGVPNNFQMTINASATPLNNDEFVSSSFSVFPNPVNNVINFTNNASAMVSLVQITDMNGRIIKSVKLNATAGEVSVSDLSSGIYMMKITSDQGIATKKIVKQ